MRFLLVALCQIPFAAYPLARHFPLRSLLGGAESQQGLAALVMP